MKKIKYNISLLVFLILILFSLSITNADTKKENLSLLQKVITIDPGHGGRDPGTRYGKILEKNLNLEISKELRKQLEKAGAIVFMTRTKDDDLSNKFDYRKKRSDLYRRIKFIENNRSDIYLSIHLNWYNDYYYGGVEILYNDINSQNKKLSKIITNEFIKSKIKTRKITTTNLYIYRNTKIPGVLIECGFLSNKNDRYLLQTKAYQKKISKIITKGVIKYLNN